MMSDDWGNGDLAVLWMGEADGFLNGRSDVRVGVSRAVKSDLGKNDDVAED